MITMIAYNYTVVIPKRSVTQYKMAAIKIVEILRK